MWKHRALSSKCWVLESRLQLRSTSNARDLGRGRLYFLLRGDGTTFRMTPHAGMFRSDGLLPSGPDRLLLLFSAHAGECQQREDGQSLTIVGQFK